MKACCIPDRLPVRELNWGTLVPLIAAAHAQIARFDEVIRSHPHPNLCLKFLTIQEAIASLHFQKVEISAEEFFLYETIGTDEEKIKTSLHQIRHYCTALKKGSFSQSFFKMLCQIHADLKGSAQKKDCGHFRDRQNWIGPKGCGIDEAYFLPPKLKSMHSALQNLQDYLHFQERDQLVQLAIFFAQLLIIHPFMDANGRVARVMIPLFLYQKKLISHPLFYLSAYFKRHRIPYFKKLFRISTTRDWEKWIEFFLTGVIREGEKSYKKAHASLLLYNSIVKELKTFCPAGQEDKITKWLFEHPYFFKQELMNHCSSAVVQRLLKMKAFARVSGRRELFKFKALIKILKPTGYRLASKRKDALTKLRR